MILITLLVARGYAGSVLPDRADGYLSFSYIKALGGEVTGLPVKISAQSQENAKSYLITYMSGRFTSAINMNLLDSQGAFLRMALCPGHPLSGLRHVDETVRFCRMQADDRMAPYDQALT